MGACKGAITPKQLADIAAYEKKGRDNLTTTQKSELTRLKKKRDNAPMFDLSDGAKSYVMGIVDQIVYDYKYKNPETKEMQKGNMCELDSIDLYNEVNFTRHVKNEVRIKGEFIQGECDIYDELGDIIKDVKTSWSTETFPKLPEHIKVGGYEWQGRGYMMLWKRSKFELAFCLVSTPEQLIEWEENTTMHEVDDIPPHLRVTSLFFDRCLEKEELIKYKVKECRKFATHYYKELMKK
jgi:hypothetical protein